MKLTYICIWKSLFILSNAFEAIFKMRIFGGSDVAVTSTPKDTSHARPRKFEKLYDYIRFLIHKLTKYLINFCLPDVSDRGKETEIEI